MKILMIGDIYGKQGMETLLKCLPEIKQTYKPQFIIANGENLANGRGIKQAQYKKLMSAGIHALTMGNWVWGQSELKTFIDDSNIVRPINYLNAPGHGYKLFNFNDKKILVINALGRTFMNGNLENPFLMIEKILDTVDADVKIVDFHAEATSEKIALGLYLDGKADLIVGTHTHVQTADERKLPNGTFYITDVGMTGPFNGVIGVKADLVIDRFINGHSLPNEVAEGEMQFNAVLVDLINQSIKRIHLTSIFI